MSSTDTNARAAPTRPAADLDQPSRDLNPGTTASAGGSPPVDLEHSYSRSGQTGDRSLDRSSDRSSDDAKQTYEQVRQFTREAGDKARDQWGEAREKFDSARHDLMRSWNEQKGRLGERAQSFADEQKGRLSGGVNDLASAARAAADELRKRDDTTIATYADSAADQLERIRDYFQHAQLGDLGREAARLTRERPEWVLGGAFVAGLAIARFLKADRGGVYRQGLPSTADESIYQDAVDQQPGHSQSQGGSDSYRGNAGGSEARRPSPIDYGSADSASTTGGEADSSGTLLDDMFEDSATPANPSTGLSPTPNDAIGNRPGSSTTDPYGTTGGGGSLSPFDPLSPPRSSGTSPSVSNSPSSTGGMSGGDR